MKEIIHILHVQDNSPPLIWVAIDLGWV